VPSRRSSTAIVSCQEFSSNIAIYKELEHLREALLKRDVHINTLLEGNAALERFYKVANQEAHQLGKILRNLSDLVAKTSEASWTLVIYV